MHWWETNGLLEDALVVVELYPQVLIETPLAHRMMILQMDVNHLKEENEK
jgi:hypothetical protein